MNGMVFPGHFSAQEQIELLERWILVQSFVYYELNDNIAPDYKYDANAIQLNILVKDWPDIFKKSRYYAYFHDFANNDGREHYVSGYHLLQRVRKKEPDLYRRIWIDAIWALDSKRKLMDDM